MKKFLLIIFLIIITVPDIFGQVDTNAYRFKYEMTINNEIPSNSFNSIPIETKVSISIVSNENYSLLTLKLTSIQSPAELSQNSKTEDSFFVDKSKFLQYSLSNKDYSTYDTIQILNSFKDLGNHHGSQFLGSIQFIQCDTLPKDIIPFPNFLGNRYGVIKVLKGNSVIELVKIERTSFNFDDYLVKIKSFRKSDSKYEIPF